METIETLNVRLGEIFGIDTISRMPIFRIVWANDQTEKRLVSEVAGIQLLCPEVREMKKYGYLKDLYVLERLVLVPDSDQSELAGVKLSYEPLWAYRDPSGNPLPPTWVATEFLINTVHAALGKTNMAKYVEPNPEEDKEKRIQAIQEELFGNETETADAVRYKEGIVVPSNYKKNEVN